jgi:hypothetical protein
MDKLILVSPALMQRIIDFLQVQPFNQVHQLIAEIMRCPLQVEQAPSAAATTAPPPGPTVAADQPAPPSA